MERVALTWFPGRTYADIYLVVVLLAALSDELVPRLMGGRGASLASRSDRGSFLGIQTAAVVGLVAGVYLRYYNIGIVPMWVQVLALVLVCAGALLRQWAIVLLGRYFSRTVTIETGHRLITSGPFHWVRHPAYTGMIIMHSAIVLGLGTWVGALLILVVMLAATLYRIRVEEKVLLEAFGDEYRAYKARTALLFPPW